MYNTYTYTKYLYKNMLKLHDICNRVLAYHRWLFHMYSVYVLSYLGFSDVSNSMKTMTMTEYVQDYIIIIAKIWQK